jgi:hypothetical protein
MICVAVNIKDGKPAWIKARPLEDGEKLFTPTPGKQFWACGLWTSPVEWYEPLDNGVRVKTENSLYEFLVLDEDAAKKTCEESGLEFLTEMPMDGIRYWGDAPQIKRFQELMERFGDKA